MDGALAAARFKSLPRSRVEASALAIVSDVADEVVVVSAVVASDCVERLQPVSARPMTREEIRMVLFMGLVIAGRLTTGLPAGSPVVWAGFVRSA